MPVTFWMPGDKLESSPARNSEINQVPSPSTIYTGAEF